MRDIDQIFQDLDAASAELDALADLPPAVRRAAGTDILVVQVQVCLLKGELQDAIDAAACKGGTGAVQ